MIITGAILPITMADTTVVIAAVSIRATTLHITGATQYTVREVTYRTEEGSGHRHHRQITMIKCLRQPVHAGRLTVPQAELQQAEELPQVPRNRRKHWVLRGGLLHRTMPCDS